MDKLIAALLALSLLVYLLVSFFHKDSPVEPQPAVHSAPAVFELKDNVGHVNIQKDFFDMPVNKSIQEKPEIPDQDPFEFYSQEIERKEEP